MLRNLIADYFASGFGAGQVMVVLFGICITMDFKMKKLSRDQRGLIPMMLSLLAILITAIVLVYIRVMRAQQ